MLVCCKFLEQNTIASVMVHKSGIKITSLLDQVLVLVDVDGGFPNKIGPSNKTIWVRFMRNQSRRSPQVGAITVAMYKGPQPIAKTIHHITSL